jgi:hypothetical protein
MRVLAQNMTGFIMWEKGAGEESSLHATQAELPDLYNPKNNQAAYPSCFLTLRSI